MYSKILLLIVPGMILLAACGPLNSSLPTGTGNPPASQTGVVASPHPLKTPSTPGRVTPNPAPGSPAPATPIPQVLTPAQNAVIEAASVKYGLPLEQINLVSSEPVTWRDGCLEVYRPKAMCTDALVDGYRIILDAGGNRLEYHTNLDGTVVVDASPQP